MSNYSNKAVLCKKNTLYIIKKNRKFLPKDRIYPPNIALLVLLHQSKRKQGILVSKIDKATSSLSNPV